jgi:type IV pilus assembly protein PilA
MFYKALQKRKKNNKKAFTLIELIVVIAIIGVLVAILVPTMNGFVSDAQDATALANARTVYSVGQAEIAFSLTNDGKYPSDADLKTAIDGQLANLDGTYVLTYNATTGDLSKVVFTMKTGGATGTYPQEAAPTAS